MWSSISAVIPVYNSQDSLVELYSRLTSALENITENHEIILVDDGSSDNSFKIMKEIHLKDSRVKVIQLDGNYGQQNAIKCGFHYAKGDYLVTLDDDLQHGPEEVEKLLTKLDEGFDVVYGIAERKQHSFYRNLGSKMTNYLFNKICSKPKEIKVSSFRVIKRNVAEKINEDKTSFVYITAITFRITRKIGNVHVYHRERKYGKSNYSLLKLLQLFLKLYIYYSDDNLLRRFNVIKPQYNIKDKLL